MPVGVYHVHALILVMEIVADGVAGQNAVAAKAVNVPFVLLTAHIARKTSDAAIVNTADRLITIVAPF